MSQILLIFISIHWLVSSLGYFLWNKTSRPLLYLSRQQTKMILICVWPFHWLIFDNSFVSVICFIFTRGVKSESRDNWATRVTLSSIPRAPGVTLTILQQCPFVFISQHFVSRLLRLIMRIEDCIGIVNTRGEGMQVRCLERHDCIVCSQISILIWIK